MSNLLQAMAVGAAVALLGLGVVGCSEGKQSTPTIERKPVLTLTQTGPLTVELSIVGPVGLRALQARVVYDAAVVKLKSVAPGKAAERLDRVFSSDLAAAAGTLTVGLSDTRQVRLPARGALLRLELEPVAGVSSGTITRIQIADPLGALEGAAAQGIAPTSAEIKLP